jgi:hypothetical protein
MQPMVAHADAEADRDPVEERGDEQVRPAEGPERRDGLDVKPDQHDASQHAELAVTGHGREGRYAAHM